MYTHGFACGLNQLEIYWNSNVIFEQNNFILQTLPNQIYIMDLQGHLNGNPACSFAEMSQRFNAMWPFNIDTSGGDKIFVDTEV